MISHYDAVVVGLGGVGSFALRALAKQSGGKFLGLEVGSLTSTAGHSSRGLTRIYRRAYFEHSHYVPWIEYSLRVFREMEISSGESLMRECGTLLIEPALNSTTSSAETSPPPLPPLLASSWSSAQLHNIHVEYLDSKHLKERFPQFQYKRRTNMVGLLEPGGGLLRPERIMKAALRETAAAGSDVTILDETQITKMVPNVDGNGRIELQLQQKDDDNESMAVTTDKLLVTMGAWTADMIPSWNRLLHPVRQIQGWIDTSQHSTPDQYSSRNMPSFVYLSPDWPESLYGVPCDDEAGSSDDVHSTNQSKWLKVGIHKQNTSQPFSFANHPPLASPVEVEELAQAIPQCIDERAWSGERPRLVETTPCLYTMSPDKHFLIGESARNIFCVAGLSGHGYKMTPAMGQMVADYALGKDVATEWKTDFCSPRRFGV